MMPENTKAYGATSVVAQNDREWKRMVRVMVLSVLAMAAIMVSMPADANDARIKDIVAFEGIRENMMMGYGLVVGLNGTGDRLNNSAFTEQSLIAFLERQGVNTRGTELRTENVAAVTVTAKLGPFARTGSLVDVNVSAMGDASDLQGGILLATPLYGADGQVYAVAQGAIAIGGFGAAGESGSSITAGVPTNGYISNGGVIENEIGFNLNDLETVRFALRNPDIATAHSISQAINRQIGPGTSRVEDPGTVKVTVPPSYEGDVVGLLADVERLPVETDQIARIVIDEATGTIVLGENVKIDTVAVAQGNLVVRVEETPQVSQPNPFAPAGAETVVVPRTEITVDNGEGRQLAVLNENSNLRDLVRGLNSLGVGPRDMITILRNIKAAGALQADIVAR